MYAAKPHFVIFMLSSIRKSIFVLEWSALGKWCPKPDKWNSANTYKILKRKVPRAHTGQLRKVHEMKLMMEQNNEEKLLVAAGIINVRCCWAWPSEIVAVGQFLLGSLRACVWAAFFVCVFYTIRRVFLCDQMHNVQLKRPLNAIEIGGKKYKRTDEPEVNQRRATRRSHIGSYAIHSFIRLYVACCVS